MPSEHRRSSQHTTGRLRDAVQVFALPMTYSLDYFTSPYNTVLPILAPPSSTMFYPTFTVQAVTFSSRLGFGTPPSFQRDLGETCNGQPTIEIGSKRANHKAKTFNLVHFVSTGIKNRMDSSILYVKRHPRNQPKEAANEQSNYQRTGESCKLYMHLVPRYKHCPTQQTKSRFSSARDKVHSAFYLQPYT